MGHIKGKRFAGILAVGLLATAGTGVAMAQGGISANLALSNTIFSQTVSSLDGDDAAIFVGTDKLRDSDVAIARLRFKKAEVTDMCMAAPVKLPGLGDKKFQMKVPGANTHADNLIIGAPGLNGGMTLTNRGSVWTPRSWRRKPPRGSGAACGQHLRFRPEDQGHLDLRRQADRRRWPGLRRRRQQG
jgi:hypothetical protein